VNVSSETLSAIQSIYSIIASDLPANVENIDAVEACITEDKLYLFGHPAAQKEINNLVLDNSFVDVLIFISRNVRLV